MYENLILYACIAFALYVVIQINGRDTIESKAKSNYAKYRLKLLIGGSKNVSK